MFKRNRLKHQLKLAQKSKLEEVKNQNFESASLQREKEIEILRELRFTSIDKLFQMINSLFFIHQSEYFYGIYIQKKETELPIYLPFYYFSCEINHYLKCFFAEHPAFRFDWSEQTHKRRSMIKEVTEYYFITEILDHFTRQDCNSPKNNCKHELNRSNIEEMLETNVFLKLFTMPLEYRKVFSEHIGKDISYLVPKDENGDSLGYYHKFQYQFPYKLKLERESSEYIISTPFLILKFHVGFDAEERLPNDFSKLFLGFEKVKAPRIDVFIDILICWPTLIYPKYWKYLKTIRTVKQQLYQSFSSDYYFQTLNWQNTYIQSRIIENIIKFKGKIN